MFNELKVFTGFAITVSDLPKKEKLAYLRIAQNATTEAELKLISYKIIKEVEIRKILKAAVIAAAAVYAAKQVYEEYFSKEARQCKGEKFMDKKRCMQNARIKALTQKYHALMREAPKCSQAHDVQKCKEKFSREAEKIRDEILKVRTSMAK